MPDVDLSRVPSFYHKYIAKVTANEMDEAFQIHQKELVTTLNSLPEDKWDFRYAEGKWSIREMVQHMIDTERIFCYRALCFARRDPNPLPGFDENQYVESSKGDQRSTRELIEEMQVVQKASALLFASFTPEMLEQSGVANGNSIYVKAIG
ncbi:MAG: DinB family protein, partial [Flavisolibacter sp.]